MFTFPAFLRYAALLLFHNIRQLAGNEKLPCIYLLNQEDLGFELDDAWFNIQTEDVEPGPNLVFFVARNSGRTDRKIDQILVSDIQMDRRMK